MCGTFGLRDIAKIDADAIPDIGATAHPVDENIVRCKQCSCAGVRQLPALQARFGGGFVSRVRNNDERSFRAHAF